MEVSSLPVVDIAVPIVCAGIAAWSGWQARQNKQLRKKLRWTLEECAQFYALEDVYCESIVSWSWHKTPLAVKRMVRAMQRARGIETPSITAGEIARELGKL